MEPGVDIPSRIADGATVAIGGNSLSRKPMALVRQIVEAGVRDLRVVSFLGSVDVEYLLASNAVAELHTAGVSLEAAGLAPWFRRARQAGSPPIPRWSEGSLHAALEAGARGLPSFPATTSPNSGLIAMNPAVRVVSDPFTGEDVVQVQALHVDVALIHATAVDGHGNAHVDGDLGVDDLLARAADVTLVSAESEDVDRSPAAAAISRVWIDGVVVDPRGAWPTGCPPDGKVDGSAIGRWAATKGEDLGALQIAEVDA